MPSINTIVADLDAGTVIGLGGAPSSDGATEPPLSTSHAIKYKYTSVQATISGTNRLAMTALTGFGNNGLCLFFEDNWSTIVKLDPMRRMVMSDKFSGCAFKVYNDGGTIYCTHIARPGGPSGDANVQLMDDYARQKGWTEVQDVRSTGVVGVNGATTVAMVSQRIGNTIDTIRLGLNGMGVAVSRHRVTTPF